MEDPRFENRIAALGVTPEGAKWLQQALYPPGQVTKTAIPDCGFHPSLRLDTRPSVVIACPDPVGATSPTWDLLVVCTPGDVNACRYVAVRAQNVDFAQSAASAPPGLASQSTFGVLSTIPTGAGVTRVGAASARFLRANVDNLVVMTPKPYLTHLNPIEPVSFRSTYRSMTAHMTASDLYNGGTVTSAQFDAGLLREEALVGTHYGDQAGALFRRYSAFLPLSEQEMTRSVPNARVDEAKHGVYVPHRMLGPTQEFAHGEQTVGSTIIAKWALGDTEATYGFASGDGIPADDEVSLHGAVVLPRQCGAHFTDVPWWLESTLAAMGAPLDTAFDNVACSVTIFRGLAPQATITLTAYVGLQLIVKPTSPYASLVENSPPEDARAVEAYYRLAQTLRGSYEARFNSLGLILPALTNLLKTYGPTVARSFVAAIAPAAAAKVAAFIKPTQPFVPTAKAIRAAPAAPRKQRARSASVASSRSVKRVRIKMRPVKRR